MRRILVSALMVGMADAPQARATDRSSLTIAVSVYDKAGVPPDIVRTSQQQMAWIYRTIGIAIQWIDTTIAESHARAAASGSDERNTRPPAFAIFIRTESLST